MVVEQGLPVRVGLVLASAKDVDVLGRDGDPDGLDGDGDGDGDGGLGLDGADGDADAPPEVGVENRTILRQNGLEICLTLHP